MSIKPETISQLEAMIKADPALVAQLQSCTDSASSAAVIAKAAAAKGMDVSAPDVVAHFEAEVAKQGAMSDEELEQVAGGMHPATPGIMISIFSLGIGCAMVSVGSAIFGRTCGGDLGDMRNVEDWSRDYHKR